MCTVNSLNEYVRNADNADTLLFLDDSEQSTLWEHVYFKDEQIKTALGARAVTLRIDANSQEAAYLSAYYAVPVVPALMIIQ